MNIGVIEIMPLGHYTLVEALIRIFCADPKNTVTIYTDKSGFEILEPIVQHNQFSATFVIKGDTESSVDFLSRVGKSTHDRLYIATIYKYYAAFLKVRFNSPVHLFIHNIDDWFGLRLVNSIKQVFSNLSSFPAFVTSVKAVANVGIKRYLVAKLLSSNSKFVVLNDALKAEIARYIPFENIEVIPFSVYLGARPDNSGRDGVFRICIPGLLSAYRRNYRDFFSAVSNHAVELRDKIEIDLLGKCPVEPSERSGEVLAEVEKLRSLGFTVYTYTDKYIPMAIFDEALSLADLIVGNMNVVLSDTSSYGKTKDTGIVFNMIKAAKPGLITSSYQVTPELLSSTVYFESYEQAVEIIRNFIKSPEKIEILKQEARKNSEKFSPLAVYKRLTR
ncbi:MAG: hypothetical protein LWX56_05495 [Ignavibacteria bacterium]|nr:hypothetical protein [Ignavibacteria bacterium]